MQHLADLIEARCVEMPEGEAEAWDCAADAYAHALRGEWSRALELIHTARWVDGRTWRPVLDAFRQQAQREGFDPETGEKLED